MELGAVKSVYENTVSQAPIAAYDYSNAKMMSSKVPAAAWRRQPFLLARTKSRWK
jgi:hypothetical protein